jgi:hypothetical protein
VPGDSPETPVSGEERVIDCVAMGVVQWEISQSMWDHLGVLSDADRERVLDLMTERLHRSCHDICVHVAEFVARRASSTKAGDTFPESWIHE